MRSPTTRNEETPDEPKHQVGAARRRGAARRLCRADAAGQARVHGGGHRQQGELGRGRQGAVFRAGQGRGDHRRHRHRPGQSEDRDEPAADELDLRPTHQPRDHPQRPARAGGQLDGLGRRGPRLEALARQQALRHRPHRQPAAPDRHRHRRQAAFGHVDQPGRQPRADRQPRGQLDQRAVDRRQAGQAGGERDDRRACGPRRVHARRPTRPGRQVPRPQGGAARSERPEGDLHQARPPRGPVAVQHRRDTRRSPGTHCGQRQQRQLRRARRHRVGDRPRSRAVARHRQGGGRRRAGRIGRQPERPPRGRAAAARLQ